MSSFLGHSLVGSSIYWLVRPSQGNFSGKRFVWLLWLIVVACAPDIDRLAIALSSKANQGLRITHSIFFSLILPCCTIVLLRLLGVKGRRLRDRSLQVILAGLSHPVLDLLVGVTLLPLLWPIALQRFKLPFGILPSAGRLQLSNYYLYRNLWIEMGALLPLLGGIFLLRRPRAKTPIQKAAIALLFLISASFMYWGYSLPR
ncbi:MAG: metal-dependent hydrolase [Oscillatoria sp. SIO1A7]|nr:metal-dependent hydrolase [Oscillatoria sp. SIO1A7]